MLQMIFINQYISTWECFHLCLLLHKVVLLGIYSLSIYHYSVWQCAVRTGRAREQSAFWFNGKCTYLNRVVFPHIKSHHLLCNKIRESLYSRLEIDFDPIIQVNAQNDRMNIEHKVDDSTNIVWLHRTTDKWLNPCINKLFTQFQISIIKYI